MGNKKYYRIQKNYLNMEEENENEIRCDTERKIKDNIMRKYD